MKIHKMTIKNVLVNPVCYGPVQYRILGECSACSQDNILFGRASLLPDEQVSCSHCGTLLMYEYGFKIGQNDEQGAGRTISVEKAILEKFRTNDEACISQLGQDFLFSINAYFSNRLRK